MDFHMYYINVELTQPSIRYTVLEMAGRQVAKCDQISFWATSFGQKYVYLSPEELCWATNSESMHAF